MSFQGQLSDVLHYISNMEQQLENYRQLLNSQIQFNLNDLHILINGISSQSNSTQIYAFLQSKQTTLQDILRVIKFYNQSTTLKLTFVQFSLMFVTRQNRLLSKVVLQRPSMGAMPNYLKNLAKKIIKIECKIHQSIFNFKKSHKLDIQGWISQNKQNGLLNLLNISKLFSSQNSFYTFIRYLKKMSNLQVTINNVIQLLTQKKCLLGQNQIYQNENRNKQKCLYPVLDPELSSCLGRGKFFQLSSYRQIQSIQKHLKRINSNRKIQLNYKIQNYKQSLQTQMKNVFTVIKSITIIEKSNEYARIDLLLCTDFYPNIFFHSFHLNKNKRLIPSSMQNYFSSFGVQISINHLYLLFKRYAFHQQGKMSYNSFQKIFEPKNNNFFRISKNRQIFSLSDISLDSKLCFIKFIKNLCQNQQKIENIKCNLLSNSSFLRDIFCCIDLDNDGYISPSDIQKACSQYLQFQLSQQQISFFFFRNKYKDPQNKIKYQQFINQLTLKTSLPKTFQ